MDVLGMNLSNPSSQLSASHHAHPYASSISSSASSSSSSVFSLDCVSSQSSISSTSTNPVDVIWENENNSQLGSGTRPRAFAKGPVSKVDGVVPPELRTHPRRTNSYSSSAPSARPPPCLLRQSERKVNFVDNLVGKSFLKKSFLTYVLYTRLNNIPPSFKTPHHRLLKPSGPFPPQRPAVMPRPDLKGFFLSALLSRRPSAARVLATVPCRWPCII